MVKNTGTGVTRSDWQDVAVRGSHTGRRRLPTTINRGVPLHLGSWAELFGEGKMIQNLLKASVGYPQTAKPGSLHLDDAMARCRPTSCTTWSNAER